ncbi:MAG: hypothetical protein ACFFA7_13810 [Promethearchaeota archaeon]
MSVHTALYNNKNSKTDFKFEEYRDILKINALIYDLEYLRHDK